MTLQQLGCYCAAYDLCAEIDGDGKQAKVFDVKPVYFAGVVIGLEYVQINTVTIN